QQAIGRLAGVEDRAQLRARRQPSHDEIAVERVGQHQLRLLQRGRFYLLRLFERLDFEAGTTDHPSHPPNHQLVSLEHDRLSRDAHRRPDRARRLIISKISYGYKTPHGMVKPSMLRERRRAACSTCAFFLLGSVGASITSPAWAAEDGAWLERDAEKAVV